MALKKEGDRWHASTVDDLDDYLLRHVLGLHFREVPHMVTHAHCAGCGAATFDLFVDDGERILRVCTACEAEHKICDLDGKCNPGSAGEIVCICMYSECEVAVGFALMDTQEGSPNEERPVGHLYVGGRCTKCGLCGIYSEWSPQGDFRFQKMAKSV
jgi:hypothetical protein